MTLEEIDVVFSRPTVDIVRENWAGVQQTLRDVFSGRFSKIFKEQTSRRIDLHDKSDTKA